MHYPVMTEKQLATRWKISVKTLRRWRLDQVGPVWHKLFRYVRYHQDDVLEFERQSAQHGMTILGRDELMASIVMSPPSDVDAHEQATDHESGTQYITAKEVAVITGLPIHMFGSREDRDRKQIPYMPLVGNVRFSIGEILRWEMASSVSSVALGATGQALETADELGESEAPVRTPRWHELVGKQA